MQLTVTNEHAQFIEALGGPTVVAKAVSYHLGKGFTVQMVSNWKKRGIPFRYRGVLTVLAQEKGVDTPEDFFGIGGAA